MVKDASLRFKKYKEKFDADVAKQRFSALKDISVEQESKYLMEITNLEETVKKSILEPLGVPTIFIKDYLLFVRCLYGLKKQYSGEVLRDEELARRILFIQRGLDNNILEKITEFMGISPKPYTPVGIWGVSVWG